MRISKEKNYVPDVPNKSYEWYKWTFRYQSDPIESDIELMNETITKRAIILTFGQLVLGLRD